MDVFTSGKLQVLVYLNGVEVAMQLARYAGDPAAWAEWAYTADGNGNGVGRDASWEEQAGELAELAAVTAEFGTEQVAVTPAVVGPVPARAVQVIASRDAVLFGPASTGLRCLIVFVVAASEIDMDEQEIPLQRAGPDTLAALGLVAQLVLPRVRAEKREEFFKRRRKGIQADYAKEKWPDPLAHAVGPADSRCEPAAARQLDSVQAGAAMHGSGAPRPTRPSAAAPPHGENRLVGAQKEHLMTMGGVDLKQLLRGTFQNGDDFAVWRSAEKEEQVVRHTFTEGDSEVGRMDSGMATITRDDGEPPFIIGVGDVVEFGAGFACAFSVHEAMTKTLVFH